LNLELCIVLACDAEGCLVRPVGETRTYHAAYSDRVRGVVRIRREQLVAVDRTGSPPEIAWRWWLGEVESVEGQTISVRRADMPPGSCTVVATGTAAPPATGSMVFYGRAGEWELADTAVNGEPEHPESVRQREFPRIELALRE